MKDLLLLIALATLGMAVEVFIFYYLLKLAAYFNNGKIPSLINEIFHIEYITEFAKQIFKK